MEKRNDCRIYFFAVTITPFLNLMALTNFCPFVTYNFVASALMKGKNDFKIFSVFNKVLPPNLFCNSYGANK